MPWPSLLQEVASALLLLGTAKPALAESFLPSLDSPTDAVTDALEGESKPEVKGPGNSRTARPIAEYINSTRFLITPMNKDTIALPSSKIKGKLDELMLGEHNNDGLGWQYPMHVAMVLSLANTASSMNNICGVSDFVQLHHFCLLSLCPRLTRCSCMGARRGQSIKRRSNSHWFRSTCYRMSWAMTPKTPRRS